MQSKSSRVLAQTGNHPKNKQNNRPSLISSPTTPREFRQTQGVAVTRNTFNFEQINSKPGSAASKNRIHGKVGTKRSGGKVVLIGQKEKKHSKESSISKLKSSERASQDRELRRSLQDINAADVMCIKSYELDNKYSSFAEEAKAIASESRDESMLKPKFIASTQVTPKSGEEQEMFKQLRRKMAAEKELFKNNAKQKNCFYANLKRKLKLQINKIQYKQDYDRLNFLIEGCNANIHAKDISSNREGGGRKPRPQTAVSASKGHFLRNQQKRARPLSERAKSYRSLQGSRLVNDLKNKTINMLNSSRNQRHTTKQKNDQEIRSVKDGIFVSCTDTLTKRKKHSQNLTEDNEKIAKILNDCQKEFTGRQHLRDNMKIFQFYCKKLDARFQRASNQLQQVQNFEIQ